VNFVTHRWVTSLPKHEPLNPKLNPNLVLLFRRSTLALPVTHIYESCHTYKWILSHIDESRRYLNTNPWTLKLNHNLVLLFRRSTLALPVTHTDVSCHTYEWVMSHLWMSQSHVWMGHVTHMNESCHTYEWVMSHVWMEGTCPPPPCPTPTYTYSLLQMGCHLISISNLNLPGLFSTERSKRDLES